MTPLKPFVPLGVDAEAVRAAHRRATVGPRTPSPTLDRTPQGVSADVELDALADHAERRVLDRLKDGYYAVETGRAWERPVVLDIFQDLHMPPGAVGAKPMWQLLMERGPGGDETRADVLLHINRRLGALGLRATELSAELGPRIGGVRSPEINLTLVRLAKPSIAEEAHHVAEASMRYLEQGLMTVADSGRAPFGPVTLQDGRTVDGAAAVDVTVSLHGVPRNTRRQPPLDADPLFAILNSSPAAREELRAEIDHVLQSVPRDHQLRALEVRTGFRGEGKHRGPFVDVVVRDPYWTYYFSNSSSRD